MKKNRKKLLAGVRGDATPVRPLHPGQPGTPLVPYPYGPKEKVRKGYAKKKSKKRYA